MASITWSGGADFTSGPVGSFIADFLAIPSGMAPDSVNILDVAVGFSFTPIPDNFSPAGALVYVDGSNTETELLSGPSALAFGPTTRPGGYAGTSSSLGSLPTLNTGGHLRMKGSVTTTISGPVTLSVTAVAFIRSDTGTKTGGAGESGVFGAFSDNRAPQSTSGSATVIAVEALAAGASLGAATTPSFTGTDWSTVVARTNGALFAGLGDYAGALNVNLPHSVVSINCPTDLAAIGAAGTRCKDIIVVTAHRRSFAQVIG